MKAPPWLATRLPTPRSGPMAGLETAWQVFRATSVWLDTEPGRTVPDWSWPTLSCSYTRYGQYKFTLPFFFYNILNNLYNCSFRHKLLLVIVCNEYDMLERQITFPIIQNSYQCSFRSWNSMLYTEHFNSSIIKSNLHWCTDIGHVNFNYFVVVAQQVSAPPVITRSRSVNSTCTTVTQIKFIHAIWYVQIEY